MLSGSIWFFWNWQCVVFFWFPFPVEGSRTFDVGPIKELSTVFDQIEQQKDVVGITNYSLSQTSLEQIFLHLSKQQEYWKSFKTCLFWNKVIFTRLKIKEIMQQEPSNNQKDDDNDKQDLFLGIRHLAECYVGVYEYVMTPIVSTNVFISQSKFNTVFFD